MELATDRLLLRPFQADDLPHLQRYGVRPEFWRYLPIPQQTPQTVTAFLEARLAAPGRIDPEADSYDINLALEARHLGILIGTIRIGMRKRSDRQGDLGFALDPDHQGRGYMTEAVRRVLQVGFGDLGLHRIWAKADVENERSWRVMQRVGMTRERLLRQDALVRGEWRDSYLYAILATDPRP